MTERTNRTGNAERAGRWPRSTGVGIIFGVVVGAGMGAAMDNVGLGVGAGIAIGVALGTAYGAARERKSNDEQT